MFLAKEKMLYIGADMTRAEKNGFRTVEEADMEDYKQKIREHRIKVLKRSVLAVFILALIFIGIGLYMALRQYNDFDIRSSVERTDTAATKFQEFHGNILKFSNDGALYTDHDNEMIWNQTFEMTEPTIDICEGYLVIYDKQGTQIYIMTVDGMAGSIETTLPIRQVSIANQGTVAVLMDNHSTGQLALYDKSGKELANGAIHGEKGGYPVAIALSNDAIKLAVSMLDINDGSIKTTVAFYNFGSVGENEIDHIVSANSFSDMVIPELDFTSSDRLLAFGDSELIIFEGTQKPKLTTQIPLSEEARSIFHNEKYIGVVYNNAGETVSYLLCVYDMNGNVVMEKEFTMEYTNIEFVAEKEVCISNSSSCDIYTTRGIYKFHYDFDEDLYKVISTGGGLNYTFIRSGVTEKVRLK